LPDESSPRRANQPATLLADGIRYERGGVVNHARDCFEAVTRLPDQHPEDVAEAWWRLANLHRLHSSWDEALRCARKSAELARENGFTNTEADALNIEGAVWYVRGDYDQARVLYLRVLELATTAGTRAKALQNAESRTAFRSAGDARGEANSLLNIGRLQLDRGFPEIANQTLDEAVSAARHTGDLEMHAAALLNHGIALGELGRSEEAEERVITAYGQFTIADIPVQRVRSLMQLAALAASRKEAGAARVCLEHARDVAESAQLPRELAMIAERLAALGSAQNPDQR
jgi:tetratricopeptide (TPR) repeat protein